ncbi:MAG: hypothetical protein B6U88_00625 [Candidatus Aenigmarchaeota archaeon ex4484_56]|nr:MAG: hypothetical protein B6U88_00625 [Candidatus Aenigmarchaeota archaeon ex4484_56]
MVVIEQITYIGIIIIFSTFLGYIAKLLKQPTIIAYLIAGVILGPYGLSILSSKEEILFLSELGIAFLLFIVGLELNLWKLKKLGKEIIIVSLIQIIIIFLSTYLIFNRLFNQIEALYLGISAAFSSTMIVVKYLSDKKKIGSLQGRLTTGILIIQDIVIIIIFSLLPNMFNPISIELLKLAINGIGLLCIAIVLNKLLFPFILRDAAKTRELFFLVSISTAFSFIILAYLLGFSIAIGGLIAGLAIATYPYNTEIESEIRPLRDFFLVILFATLGMQINIYLLLDYLQIILLLFLILLILKPLTIIGSLKIFGYNRRIPILVGIPLAQASEFSFIFAQEGLSKGYISQDFYSLVISVVFMSIAISPYLFSISTKLANKISREKINVKKKKFKNHIVLLGCHKAGKYLVENLKNKIIAVDHDPDVIENLKSKNILCTYGEADNKDILKAVNVKEAQLVISAVPDLEANLFIVKTVKEINKDVIVIAKAFTISDALQLYFEGADYVVIPMKLTGEKLLNEVKKILKGENIKKLKNTEIKRLVEEYSEGFLI